jgi:hypothetical protein
MKSSLFVFCLIFLLCCQCASLTDRKQYVRVAPPKAQTKIYYDSELVGQGPSTLRITRKPRPQIIFQDQGKNTPLTLKTKYRWGHSFAGNALLLSVAPIGWVADFATGAAWESQDILSSNMSSLDHNSRILIMPPVGVTSQESRQLGQLIEKWLSDWLKEKKKTSKVLSFDQTYYTSLGLGFDEESSTLQNDIDTYNELLHDTDATHLVFSQYSDENALVELIFYDPYAEKIIENKSLGQLPFQKEEATWSSLLIQSFEFLPNTLSLGSITTAYSGCASNASPQDFRYCAKEGEPSALSFISSLSLGNILHFRKRQPWRVYFRFYPDFNISANQLDFVKASSSLPDLSMDWVFISLGYGPRLSFILPIGEIFMDAMLIQSLNYTKLYTNNFSQTQWVGGVGASSQAGIHSWVSNHWNIRAYLRIQSLGILQDLRIDGVDPGTQFADGIGIVQAGISVGYYFEEEKMKWLSWK